jgi:hypothetical protein
VAGGPKAAGRCVPHLVCWLEDDRFVCRDAHVLGSNAFDAKYTRLQRSQKREDLKQSPEGREILSKERPPQHIGEDEEPRLNA